MNVTKRLKKYAVIACAGFLAFSIAIFGHGQATSNVEKLRRQLSARYQIVPLDDGLALVPRQRNNAIRLVEVRNGAVAINGGAVTAREASERLGRDAVLIIQATYLNAAEQRELAGAAPSTPANAPDKENEPQGETPPPRTQIHRGDLVRFGGAVTVGRDEVVDGDVVAIGGYADINGEVAREVTVVGGSLNLGPDAVVRGDVTVVGGSLKRAPGARIDGKVSEVAMGAQLPSIPRGRHIFPFRAFVPHVGSFFGTLLRMALLILFALIVVILGGRFVQAIADRAAAEPLRSGLAGLLAEVLFVPLVVLTIVVLAVSIIGIPFLFLVPFAVVLAFVLMLVGFTGVSSLVGRFLSERFGIRRGPYISVAVGVLAVVGITLVAKLIGLVGGLVFGVVVANSLAALGYLAEYIAWTIGIGALILTWFSARHRAAPAAAVVAAPPPAGCA